MVDQATGERIASRDGLGRLLGDCMLLLDHLTGIPDARLDWCFEESRMRSAGTPPARIVPPPAATPTKAAFLERLTALHCRLAQATAGELPLTAGEIAFLIAARDFLSTLAHPVSVETIRITREYVRPSRWWRDLGRMLAGRRGDQRRPEPLRGERFGRRLAVAVLFWQGLTLVLVGLTVWLSIYALIGRGLVQEVRALDVQFIALGGDLGKAEQEDATTFLVIGGAGNNPAVNQPPGWRHYCEMRDLNNGARTFATRQQQRLCDRYEGYNQKYVQLFDHLRTWRATRPGRSFPSMGVRADTGSLAPSQADGVAKMLSTVQEMRLELVNAEVVLRAIAEYLLPCLYAMLGALAAALRHVARKVEAVTLDFTDGGVIGRTVVLGVLFGAVIGLFASQLNPLDGSASPAAASLTPAALSLLAGYAVAQVFQFFDGLALRVFGPRQANGAAAG